MGICGAVDMRVTIYMFGAWEEERDLEKVMRIGVRRVRGRVRRLGG